MSDTITLWDHDPKSAACVAAFVDSHVPDDGSYWCPGGREMHTEIKSETVHRLDGWRNCTSDVIRAWVEVSDG